MKFETRRAAGMPDAIAPDGSEVRVLCGLPRGGLALFSLPPDAVSKAVAHRTVEELWYVVSGYGRIWRRLDGQEEIVELGPGVSLSIPLGTQFQFRCDGRTAARRARRDNAALAGRRRSLPGRRHLGGHARALSFAMRAGVPSVTSLRGAERRSNPGPVTLHPSRLLRCARNDLALD